MELTITRRKRRYYDQGRIYKKCFFVNAWDDTVQHVKFYLTNMSENEKEKFKNYLKEKSYKIIDRYKREQISFEEHTACIKNFWSEVTEEYNNPKGKINFEFGRAQKLINVLLKYYWCAKMLNGHMPAHMPLDSIILNILAKKMFNVPQNGQK